MKIRLRVTGERHFQSLGNEAWVLDICDKNGNSVAGWDSMQPESPWRIVDTDKKSHAKALIVDKPAEIRLNVPPEGKLRLLKHPWSGIIEIESEGRVQKIDLFSSAHDTFTYQIRHTGHQAVPNRSVRNDTPLSKLNTVGSVSNEDEETWIAEIAKAQPAAVAILHPQWRGVRKSAEELFNYTFCLEDNLDLANARRMAVMIDASGCKRIVICGFPHSYRYLVEAIYNLESKIEVFVIWYASFLQSDEEFGWRGFKIIHELCQKGMIKKWGFAKKGMAEAVALAGVDTGFVMHSVRQIPSGPSHPPKNISDTGGPHLGLWALASIWRKSPYAMMAAAARFPQAELFIVGQNERAREFGNFFGIQATYMDEPIPQNEMPAALARMHLNLYVTLSECAPMLPLESLSVGVPCLIGPNSHLFEDHPYLHSRLVVPYPDRSDIIAQFIQKALEERNEIVEAYIRYAPDYNRRARQSLCDFLEIPSDSVL